jgi:hypothetical protein
MARHEFNQRAFDAVLYHTALLVPFSSFIYLNPSPLMAIWREKNEKKKGNILNSGSKKVG